MTQFSADNSDILVGHNSIKVLDAKMDRKYLRIDNKSGAVVTFKLGEDFGGPLSEVQHVGFSIPAVLGNWSLVYKGQETTVLTPASNAAAVQAALEALTTIGSGNVVVAGDYTAGFSITFQGVMANVEVDLMSVNVNELLGTAASASQTVSFTADGGTFTLTFRGQTTTAIPYNDNGTVAQAALQALSTVNDGGAIVTNPSSGVLSVAFAGPLANQVVPLLTATSSLTNSAAQASKQGILYAGPAPASGDYKLMVGAGVANTTASIAYNANAAAIQAALEALTSVGAGNVAVSGTDLVSGMTVTFQGALADASVPDVIPYNNRLIGFGDAGLAVNLIFVKGTEGQPPAPAPVSIVQVTPGSPAGAVAISFHETTVGRPQPQDGTDIKAMDYADFAASVPVDAVYVKASMDDSPIAITEG